MTTWLHCDTYILRPSLLFVSEENPEPQSTKALSPHASRFDLVGESSPPPWDVPGGKKESAQATTQILDHNICEDIQGNTVTRNVFQGKILPGNLLETGKPRLSPFFAQSAVRKCPVGGLSRCALLPGAAFLSCSDLPSFPGQRLPCHSAWGPGGGRPVKSDAVFNFLLLPTPSQGDSWEEFESENNGHESSY